MALVSHALTTVARVKARIPNISGSSFDTLFENIINGVTDFIENYCQRRFKETTYTNQLYDGYNSTKQSKRSIILKQFPITDLSSVQFKTDDDSWNSYGTTEYVYDSENGIITKVSGNFAGGYQNLRVTYDAGFVIDFSTPANMTLPYDLINAAEELTIRMFKRREDIGKSAMNVQGDTVNYLDKLDAQILEVLDRYRKSEFY